MATDPARLDELTRQLAALSPEERAQLFARFASERPARPVGKPISPNWKPPLIRGGGTWTGGSLRREEMYDDDGR